VGGAPILGARNLLNDQLRSAAVRANDAGHGSASLRERAEGAA
jgi:hypothetical protein